MIHQRATSYYEGKGMAGNTSEKKALSLMASHVIVKSHNVDNDIELRIVADDRPLPWLII